MEQIFLLLFQNAVKCTTLILIYLMSVMLFEQEKCLDRSDVGFIKGISECSSCRKWVLSFRNFFSREKNLITELEAEIENHYYYAHQQLNRLYYDQADMKLSKYGSAHQIQNEDEGSAYQHFKKLLQTNLIDFFFMVISIELAVIERLVNLVYNLVNLMSTFFMPNLFQMLSEKDLSKEKLINLFRVRLSFSCSVWRKRAFCFDCFKWFTGGFLSLKIVYSHSRKRRIGLYDL